MKSKTKTQAGYLLVVAAFLVVVIGFFASTIAYMFMGGTQASTNILQSNTAFYIALSGIEMAKRAILFNKNTCSSINTTFANVAFPLSGTAIGSFTVTGTSYSYSSQLSGAINDTIANITVSNATGFATGGIGAVSIGSEIITYPTIASNTLTNVRRGAAGTTAAAHPSSAPVVQNMCVLRSTGQLSILADDGTSPMGRRVLVESLFVGTGNSPFVFSVPGISSMPPAISAGTIIVDGGTTTVSNPNACGTGCALASRSSITNNSSHVTCSTTGCPIVDANDTDIPSDYNTFYNSFFNQSEASMETSGNPVSTISDINDIITSGQPGYGKSVVVFNGNLNLTSGSYLTTAPPAYPGIKILIVTQSFSMTTGVTIGSATNPVIIISLGPANTNGGTIYGILYGKANVSLGSTTYLYGAAAAFQGMTINSNSVINFTQQVFNALSSSSTTTVQGGAEVFS